VGEGVDRAVKAELVIERRGEDEHVGGEHATGMVGHQQRAARGRDGIQPLDLGPEVPLDQWADEVLDLLGEAGVPLGGLALADPLDVPDALVAHVFPLCVLACLIPKVGGEYPLSTTTCGYGTLDY
jgi:hypothetical protein